MSRSLPIVHRNGRARHTNGVVLGSSVRQELPKHAPESATGSGAAPAVLQLLVLLLVVLLVLVLLLVCVCVCVCVCV